MNQDQNQDRILNVPITILLDPDCNAVIGAEELVRDMPAEKAEARMQAFTITHIKYCTACQARVLAAARKA